MDASTQIDCKLVIDMLRAHARSEHHCEPGEVTRALAGDYRWQAAELLSQTRQGCERP